LQQIQCGRIFINHITAIRRLEVCGNPPPGLRTFGIPTGQCLPFTWRNQYSDGNTIQIYKPSTEVAVVTNPFFEAIDVSIPEQEISALTHHLELPQLDKIIDKREMVDCDPAKMHKLRSTLRLICDALASDPGLLQRSPELRSVIQNEIPGLLIQALMSSDRQGKQVGTATRNKAMKKAIDYFHEMPNETTSYSQFCRESGIHERTLQRAFRDVYGVSPKAYAKAIQLNKIYKKLIKGNQQDTTISGVAGEFGFWHMGQFASDYRRHFGELPSTTLKSR
jgi:AraC family ethanolamine operon transcriptional activator